MRLYVDDDSASPLLAKLLRNAGHEVQIPSDAGMAGAQDAVHLTHSISDDRVCVTKNHDDFWVLHNLICPAAIIPASSWCARTTIQRVT